MCILLYTIIVCQPDIQIILQYSGGPELPRLSLFKLPRILLLKSDSRDLDLLVYRQLFVSVFYHLDPSVAPITHQCKLVNVDEGRACGLFSDMIVK